MAKTRHIHKRMSQRGINSRLVDLVAQFGMDHGDKCILTRKNAEALIGAVDALRSLHIPAHRDRPFRLNVTACSG
ncbi:hypothetical protein [Marinobacter nauticus]|uniref:hypothetical protein n=1 Tax=Marinobacter nauticus TaxID=2743 RepID=UPI00032290CB|nr:hypothetical protein [Marinobacter nauticus]